MNLFSEKFNMKYVLEKMETDFLKNKDLLYHTSNQSLNLDTSSSGKNIYENDMKEKQKQIIKQARMNYKRLNNINYVKYYLPYSIQPETNNTNVAETKQLYKANFKQSILKELQMKKQMAEYKISNFIKRHTGQFKGRNVLHTQVSKLYKKKKQIEIFLKNKRCTINDITENNGNKDENEKTQFTKVIGNIVFFDKQINVLIQDAIIKNNNTDRKVPWVFIQSDSIVLLREYIPPG